MGGDAVTVLICAVLAVLAVVGVLSYRKRLKSGCCGAADGKAVKKVRVVDKNRSHYPYRAVLRIDGMTCENCTRRVENALNTMEGVWATADLYKGRAEVLMKRPVPAEELRARVNQTGYTVLAATEAGKNA